MPGYERIEGQEWRLPTPSSARKIREKEHKEEAPGFWHEIVTAL